MRLHGCVGWCRDQRNFQLTRPHPYLDHDDLCPCEARRDPLSERQGGREAHDLSPSSGRVRDSPLATVGLGLDPHMTGLRRILGQMLESGRLPPDLITFAKALSLAARQRLSNASLAVRPRNMLPRHPITPPMIAPSGPSVRWNARVGSSRTRIRHLKLEASPGRVNQANHMSPTNMTRNKTNSAVTPWAGTMTIPIQPYAITINITRICDRYDRKRILLELTVNPTVATARRTICVTPGNTSFKCHFSVESAARYPLATTPRASQPVMKCIHRAGPIAITRDRFLAQFRLLGRWS